MRMDQLTSKLQSALAEAQSLALGQDNQFIEPVHLVHAMVEQKGGSVRPLLAQTGFNLNELRKGLKAIIDRLPKVEGGGGDVTMSNDLGRLMNLADKITQKNGDSFISSESVLLAAMADKGELGQLLNSFGVTEQALKNAIDNLRGGEKVTDAEAEAFDSSALPGSPFTEVALDNGRANFGGSWPTTIQLLTARQFGSSG